MKPIVFAQLKAIQADAHAAKKAQDALVVRIDAMVAEHSPKDAAGSNPEDWKRPDGRISDVGALVMEGMFASDRPVGEIAKDFKCSPSAVSHRKKLWEARTGAQPDVQA